MTTRDRDRQIEAFVEALFDRVDEAPVDDRPFASDLDYLFAIPQWGFREILFTVAIARVFDSAYLPSERLYDCNPRALYEGPIRSVLVRRRIPRRQSGPLNIAKAAEGLNSAWAAQRRPRNAAIAVLKLIRLVETGGPDQLDTILLAMARRFAESALMIQQYLVDVGDNSDPVYLAKLFADLIVYAPDSGNTAQRISGLLLLHHGSMAGIEVEGHADRASTTSGTSKKAGDIIEKFPDGSLVIYEVTTKPFGPHRVHESWDSLAQIGLAGDQLIEVIVICRPEDVHPDAEVPPVGTMLLGTLVHDGVVYRFVDLSEWMMAMLLRLSLDRRALVYLQLDAYIAQPNTALAVKQFWQNWHNEQESPPT
jgi:hypothetical protein